MREMPLTQGISASFWSLSEKGLLWSDQKHTKSTTSEVQVVILRRWGQWMEYVGIVLSSSPPVYYYIHFILQSFDGVSKESAAVVHIKAI